MIKIIIGIFLALILSAGSVFAAGSSCTLETVDRRDGMDIHTFTWVGDDATGAVPNCVTFIPVGYVCRVVTNPGSTAPLDNYDLVLNDDNGVDIMEGGLANRDTANTEQAMPTVGGVAICVKPLGTVTQVMTNQTNVDATGVTKIYVVQKDN